MLIALLIKGFVFYPLEALAQTETEIIPEGSRVVSVPSTSEGCSSREIRPESELRLELEHLLNFGSILYVAAHPDDENNLLFARLARGEGYRVGYFSFTRGEGGQNLIGDEQGAELGALRTQELLAARREDGAEQFFGGMNDFGFSKSPEETLATWGKDVALGALVRVIREFQPDVIITRFPDSGEGGHGHHTASAVLAREAFDAAADPSRFAEQLAFTRVWRTKRLFYNELPQKFIVHPRGMDDQSGPKIGHASSHLLQTKAELIINGYHPAIGESYSEIAARARSLHRSQGMGTAPVIEPFVERFRVVAGAELDERIIQGDPSEPVNAVDLFGGMDLSWSGTPAGDKFIRAVNDARTNWNQSSPELNVPYLLETLRALRALPESAIIKFKEIRLLRLIKEVAGIRLVSSPKASRVRDSRYLRQKPWLDGPESRDLKPGDANIISGQPIELGMGVESKVKMRVRSIKPSWTKKVNLGVNIGIESPWSSSIVLPSKALKGGDRLNIRWEVSINGTKLSWDEPISMTIPHPIFGEQVIPLRVVPDLSIEPLLRAVYIPINKRDWTEVLFSLRGWNPNLDGVEIIASADMGWEIDNREKRIDFIDGSNNAQVIFRVRAPRSSTHPEIKEGLLRLEVRGGDGSQKEIKYVREIDYPHIVSQILELDSSVKLVPLRSRGVLRKPYRIGYVEGASDTLTRYLKSLGYSVEMLNTHLLQSEDLSKFNAIILGIRSLAVKEDLKLAWSNLTNYIRMGGDLLILYQQTTGIPEVKLNFGEAFLKLGRARVTQENAPVKMINPVSRGLKYPNVIRDSDFSGWIQERGLSFAEDWNENCIPSLEMSDLGEPVQRGALLECRLGKGRFIYTGLSFFRQIPFGNAGAVRLMENLLVR